MRIRCQGVGILVTLLVVPAAPALAANQTVVAQGTPLTRFVPQHVGLNVGEMVTWNNGNGVHNVRFDDGSFDMPPDPIGGAWSVSRTFNTPGVYGYYCELHGSPGSGMWGSVAVNTGYPRPQSGSPLRTSLVVAYKQCVASNRQHGPPDLPGGGSPDGSCNPPVQESDWLTVGSPDANSNTANSVGTISLKTVVGTPGPPDDANVQLDLSMTDVRNKSTLTDYTGQLQARLALRVTDRHSGPSFTEPATGDTTFTFTIPCTGTGDPAIGSTCSITTTADAVLAGAVQEAKRTVWEVGQVQVVDGGSDGVASTTPNTVFAKQGVFVP